MPRVFADPDISSPSARSYVDIVSNTGLIRTLSATEDLGRLMTGRLPEVALPLFLHEGTHHWCFHSSLGVALAGLYYRGIVGFWLAANTVQPETSADSTVIQPLDDILRFQAATKLLQPLMEGLALFAEFDCSVDEEKIMPLPLGVATALFSGSNKQHGSGKPHEILQAAIRRAHESPEVVQRKTSVVVNEFTPSRNPYLSGYLAVKRLWWAAARNHDAFATASTFLVFLRNYIFEDLALVSVLLDEKYVESAFLGPLSNYLADRFDQLRRKQTYAKIDAYFSGIEKEANRPMGDYQGNIDFPAALSLSEPEAADRGRECIRRLTEEIREDALRENGSLRPWSWAWDGLSDRHPLILDVSDVFIRVTDSGVCSAWPRAQCAGDASKAMLLGAQCSNKAAWGKEGAGTAAMLVSSSAGVAFAAFILNEELVFDTLHRDSPVESFEALRNIARELPNKMAVQNELEAVLGPRLLEPIYEATLEKRASAMIDALYLSLALPWLGPEDQVKVAAKLDGLGLGRLFPQQQRGYLIRLVVSWSLGAPATDEDLARYLATGLPGESMADLIERSNQYAREVWGEGLIHIEGDGIRCIF